MKEDALRDSGTLAGRMRPALGGAGRGLVVVKVAGDRQVSEKLVWGNLQFLQEVTEDLTILVKSCHQGEVDSQHHGG